MSITRSAVALVVATLLLAPPSGLSATQTEKTDNVTVVGRIDYTGGVEMSFDGDLVIAGQRDGISRDTVPEQGAIRVVDVAGGAFDLKGTLPCYGNDNYLATVRPGLVAVAHHASRLPERCNPRTTGNGMFLVDVTDPANPRRLVGVQAASAHALTPHPDGQLVYISPGGLANGSGVTTIVDTSNPTFAEVVGTYRSSRIGCHDIGFHPTEPLAYCAGLGEVQIWDVSDPTAPETIGTILNPLIQFGHNAVVSPDGTKLVINDEAFVAHECTSENGLIGALWIYDLSDPRLPVPAGRIAPPTGAAPVGGAATAWCTSHNYNFVGPDVVVSSWFTGGTTVHDISNPALPELIASYRPADANAYTAHWHRGRVYVNDLHRGLEALEIDDPRLAG